MEIFGVFINSRGLNLANEATPEMKTTETGYRTNRSDVITLNLTGISPLTSNICNAEFSIT
jgi:hypothetical protein